jgi:hypothetical protein
MSITFSGIDRTRTRTVDFGDGKPFEVPESVNLCEDQEEEFDHPLFLNLCSANGRAFLELLGFEPNDELYGEASVADVRRALMVARATFDRKAEAFTREDEATYGGPRTNSDGTVELRPLRSYGLGLGTDQLAGYIDRLAALTEALAAKGATHITWG